MTTGAQTFKEKGNAAFKTGDYPTAIGNYTSAILADSQDHTFPLNRAAAYLKLGKNEDAERDCTRVLELSNGKNAKALFRRGQARRGIGTFDGAIADLRAALSLESGNQSVKDELRIVQGLKEAQSQAKKLRVDREPIDLTRKDPYPPHPKRRTVPITIIDPEALPAEPVAKPTGGSAKFEQLTPLSSRPVRKDNSTKPVKSETTAAAAAERPLPPSHETTEPPPATSTPPLSQRTTRAGIFRASGQSTIFPLRNPPPLKEPPKTLFALTRAWDACNTDEQRWNLLKMIPPTSLSPIFKTSLEAPLLVGFLRVLHARKNEVESARSFLVELAKVPRISTVLLFLNQEEKQIAREVVANAGIDLEGVWKLVS